MIALIVLLLIVAVFGGFGFAAHVLWIVLLVALALWALGFLIGGARGGADRATPLVRPLVATRA